MRHDELIIDSFAGGAAASAAIHRRTDPTG